MDAWLAQHLFANGRITETGLTRTAKPRRCTKCNAAIIAGLDDDVCASTVHADPVPLSVLGEALALVEGRRTVALAREAGRWMLHIRDDFQIRGRPAGITKRWDVLRSHVCGTGPPAGVLAAPSSFATATAERLPPGSPAPF